MKPKFATFAPLILLAAPLTSVDAQSYGKNAPPTQNSAPVSDEPDPVVEVPDRDVVMRDAIAQVHATLPDWQALFADPPPGYTNFTLKFPLEGNEHIWVDVISISADGEVTGTLANSPHAAGWSYGDRVIFPLSSISDWAYFDDQNVAHGYFTLRVMFNYMPAAEVAELKRNLGWAD